MVANILPEVPITPPPDPGDVVNRSKFNFFRTLSCCIYQIKGNRGMQEHSSKYFARRPLPYPNPLTPGSIGQYSTFSENGHVAYQNKEITNAAPQHGRKYFARRPPLPGDPRGIDKSSIFPNIYMMSLFSLNLPLYEHKNVPRILGKCIEIFLVFT